MMKNLKHLWLSILLITIFATPCLAVDYWWLVGRSGVLVHAIVDEDEIQIDKRFHPADRRSAVAIHPTDGSCWVTDTFQGRVTQYTPHKTISLAGFAAPVGLALDPRTNTLWIADAALHFVTQVSMTGKTLQKVEVRSPKALAIGPEGNCWVLTWRGIQPIVNGQVEPPIQKEVALIANTPDATVLWSVTRKGLIYRFDSNGMQRLPFALPDCKGAVATSDGGCWLLTPKQGIRISGQMEFTGEVTGFDYPKALISQPTDGSVWVIDSGYERAIRLPEHDTPSAAGLVGLTGWGSVVKRGAIYREAAPNLHWESYLTPEPAVPPPMAETPPQETPPPPPEATLQSDPAVTPAPELETLPTPETQREDQEELTPPLPEDVPEMAEDSPSESPTEVTPETPDPSLAPEATPDSTPSPPESPAQGAPETTDVSPAPEVSPTPEELPDSIPPTVVRIPPDETFEHIPEFPQGGVTLVKLHDELSQQRIKNTDQTLGRRFVWNFDGESYTLLLGLAVEVYNTYSNRDRDKWVQMVIEGVPAAMEIAKPMQELAQTNGWNREKLANFILSFTQSLPYTADDVATGYDEFKMYGFETLVAGGGDCEDTVILAASLLLALDYDLMLLNPKGHLAFGVAGAFGGAYFEHNGKRYFYSETTGTGWNIGDIPDIYADVSVTLYEVPQRH